MTKKDYELIAGVIKTERSYLHGQDAQAELGALENLALALGQKLSEENPRFDYFKFTEACGIRD